MKISRCLLIGFAWPALLSVCRGPALAEEAVPLLRVTLALASEEVAVGEPLVVTLRLENASTVPVRTHYSRPDIFREMAGIELRISKGDVPLVSLLDRAPGGGFITPRERLSQDWDMAPGARVSAEKTFSPVLREDKKDYRWLGPGTYRARAHVRLQGHGEPLESNEVSFVVKPLDEKHAGALDLWTPALAVLLDGEWGRPTDEMLETARLLREKFPNLPHRAYLDYRILDRFETAEAYGPAAMAYLREFPRSPYRDDVLLWLAQLERQAGWKESAAARLEALLKECPDSPLKQEAEELLAILRAALTPAGGSEEGVPGTVY